MGWRHVLEGRYFSAHSVSGVRKLILYTRASAPWVNRMGAGLDDGLEKGSGRGRGASAVIVGEFCPPRWTFDGGRSLVPGAHESFDDEQSQAICRPKKSNQQLLYPSLQFEVSRGENSGAAAQG